MVPASVYDDLITCSAVASIAAELIRLNDDHDDAPTDNEAVELRDLIDSAWLRLRFAVSELPGRLAYPQPADKVT